MGHLALADLSAFFLRVVKLTHELLAKQFDAGGSDILCIILRADHIGVMTSALIDVHIAIASAVTIFRCIIALPLLTRRLVIAWPVGIALTIPDDYNSGGHWRHEVRRC